MNGVLPVSEEIQAEKKVASPPRGASRRRPKKNHRRYGFEVKLKAVKLYLEEGFTAKLISQELGPSQQVLSGWVKQYRAQGEEGLKAHSPPPLSQAKIPPAVASQIVQVKEENPSFGIKRISQWLRRTLFLKASPETVRQHLHKEGLIEPKPPRKERNMTRPRFFERATPNQMWQSDIFTFRLGGRYAYLIAFLDDYSRFMVGADLFRSPTAEAVIEVYRQAIAEFKPPKEMLTDNGRQYTSWRGTSRFEAELKKDGVAHFKSRPQHPMTLGKIERFWSTIWQEFLTRAQFESFDSARERIKHWIKYYNHKRPHQAIEGLCPADRFFEIQTELRKTIEAGIAENLLEMALRGQPRAPFYMVGRMDGQSVVLRAEKGKLKLEVSDQEQTRELSYDLNKGKQGSEGKQTRQTDATVQPQLLSSGESPGRPGGMDRALPVGGNLPGTQNQLHDLSSMAAAGHGGNVAGSGEPGESGQGGSIERAPASAVAETTANSGLGQNLGAPGPDPACQNNGSTGTNALDDRCQNASGHYPSGPLGPTDCHPGSPGTGNLPPALLPMGETGPAGDASSVAGQTQRTPSSTETGPASATTSEAGNPS